MHISIVPYLTYKCNFQYVTIIEHIKFGLCLFKIFEA